MTREEIIKEAAADHRDIVCCGFDDPIADAQEASFITGAEWEHKRLVDKACEWLIENMSRYVSRDDPDKFPYGFPTRAFRVGVNFKCDFKKAMEE